MQEAQGLTLFKKMFSSIYPEILESEWAFIASNCTYHTIAGKQNIIRQDEIQKNIYFLTSGLVRGFYINSKGEEMTIRFINNQGWITHYTALISNIPSKYIFQSLEPCTYITLPFSTIQDSYERFKGLEKFGRLVAESILKTQQNRIESFQFQNAEQRYISFIETYPELYNRVSLSHLCTYLGIQRQSLTRIRKKIASQ